MTRLLSSLLMCACVSIIGCSAATPTGTVPLMTPEAVFIEAPAALVGHDLKVVRDAGLLIEDGMITQVGRASDIDVPASAARIDAAGMTLIPGFIDSHVHIGFADPAEVAARGVTTVRDLAWPPDEIFPVAERSAIGGPSGPLVLAAGQMLTVPGGYPTQASWAPEGTGGPVTSVEEAEAAVHANVERGASVIKVALNPPAGPVLSFELLRAIVDAAHEAGRKVTGHIYGLEELNKALDAGVDELAHMLMSPERIPPAVIERMVAQDVAIVPTLSIRSGSDRLIAIDNLRRFREAGGRVVYGTDLGNAGPQPGIDRTEVTAMAEAGMTPLEIIRSATVAAGEWLEQDEIGVLKKGARGDVVGLRGDPIEDLAALMKVGLVLRGGARFR